MRLLVRLAAIIRLIKPRTFEDDGSTGSNQATQLELATFGALLENLRIDSLIVLELMVARITLIIVSRHFPVQLRRMGSSPK